MKVGDLVKAKGIAGFGIVTDVDPYGHLFVCWPNDGTFLYAPHGLELVSEGR